MALSSHSRDITGGLDFLHNFALRSPLLTSSVAVMHGHSHPGVPSSLPRRKSKTATAAGALTLHLTPKDKEGCLRSPPQTWDSQPLIGPHQVTCPRLTQSQALFIRQAPACCWVWTWSRPSCPVEPPGQVNSPVTRRKLVPGRGRAR